MVKNKRDLRFVKSQQRLYSAFEELLRKKSFDEISVRDICAQANTSRSGFYLHFEDKYDLVQKYQREFIEHGMQIMKEKKHLGIQIIFENVLDYLNTDGEILAILLSNRGSIEIQSQIKDHFRNNAQQNIFPKYNLKSGTDIENCYLTAMLSGAFFGILEEWIHQGKKETPAQLIQLMSENVIPSLKNSELL
ncbi:TetR/AcrR family transcriptional regulator [Lentilactobacillus sp. SPB1-3]|uniref:TetR/AcrR family transcriptional regulator n=1 Tax=Lentilactobacillus terminaliae TaxID=3003483 RepID=A0ACD5DGP4_9LACO|nr:TetR/AcrR family transcriptional regulator [Lentilactobacillus sp. SPB1-3]MCZ0977051.1 TetR/AcrR family transcriptional regulator [Lentilactobacillus sp. SPB1-3]